MRGRACHTPRGFVEVAIWGTQRVKNTCSLSVQVHKKVEECFCLALPLTHISTLVELMLNYKHSCPGQVCGMLLVLEDNLSSMIYLLSNVLSSPKRTVNCKL